MSKFVVKTVNLSLVFTENKHLVKFSSIMKVLFQCTKRRDFYTHQFKEVLAYVVILIHFIWKLINWMTILGKKNHYPNLTDLCIINQFLTNCINLKLLFRTYLKEISIAVLGNKVLYTSDGCCTEFNIYYFILYLF